MFAAIITPKSISFHAAGRPRIVDKSHINYAAVLKQVQAVQSADPRLQAQGIEDLLEMVDIQTFKAKYIINRVQISEDEVRFDGKKISGVVADRILAFDKEGIDIAPLARFLDRVHDNTDIQSHTDIYMFLESGHMPITVDGCFLAYKYVRDDYYSVHSGNGPNGVRNMVGDAPSMPREDCDKDRSNKCSRGLHFCSYQYLKDGGYSSGNRIVVVKVAPEDVVAIPLDYNRSKGRSWRYVVVDEVEYTPALESRYAERPVVASEGLYDGGDDGDPSDSHLDDEIQQELEDGDEHNSLCGCIERDPPVAETVETGAVGVTKATVETTQVAYEPVFQIAKRKWISATDLKQMVADFGQRGTARKLKVARTTIQDWLKRG